MQFGSMTKRAFRPGRSRLSTNQANQFRIHAYATQSRIVIRGAISP